MELGAGVSGRNLLYIGWINKVLLWSTGSCNQYSVINHMEKNMKENMCVCVCVCVCESFCSTLEN